MKPQYYYYYYYSSLAFSSLVCAYTEKARGYQFSHEKIIEIQLSHYNLGHANNPYYFKQTSAIGAPSLNEL